MLFPTRSRIALALLFLLFTNLVPSLAFGETTQRKDIFHVEDYGILPNGEPISERLSKLSLMVSSLGGGIIQFGSGTYIMGSGLTENSRPTGSVRLYSDVMYQGVAGTVIKANETASGFHAMFHTVDHSLENVVFDSIVFDTYIGSRNKRENDFRLAIILHWCKNVTIRNCRFINDIGAIDTRYSHNQDDKNEGIYRVNGLVIENCIFESRILKDYGYKDITCVGICAQNVFFRHNQFLVNGDIKRGDNKYYPNCCLEVQGKDIWVYGNTFAELTNAIDISSSDTYQGYRNIHVYNNRIECYRGVALWSKESFIVKGIYIQNNNFKLSCDNPRKRVTGIKGAVVLVSHLTDSNNGSFSDIIVSGNVFDYENSFLFYNSLSYADWISSSQRRFDEKNGISYDEFYSVIALGGTSKNRSNIYVLNNEFRGCVFPCIYIGGANESRNHYVCNNLFINCSGGNKWPIVSLVNKCENIFITANSIRNTKKTNEKNIVLCQTKETNHLNNRMGDREVIRSKVIINNNEFDSPLGLPNVVNQVSNIRSEDLLVENPTEINK